MRRWRGFDHVSRDGTDKGVERSRADHVHDALADPFRIETNLRETFGKYGLVTGDRHSILPCSQVHLTPSITASGIGKSTGNYGRRDAQVTER